MLSSLSLRDEIYMLVIDERKKKKQNQTKYPTNKQKPNNHKSKLLFSLPHSLRPEATLQAYKNTWLILKTSRPFLSVTGLALK